MMRYARIGLVAAAMALACSGTASGQAARPAGREARTVTVTLVHLNDIYEIQPIEGGRFGGPARVATVVARLKKTAAPAFTTLGGDYLSPSALGTARVDGEPLAGRQMVDVLGAMGLDWATFGNHEFDVSEAAFRAHLKQARFRIISTNVRDAQDRPFEGVPTSVVIPVRAGGRTIRLGVIGVTVGSTKKPWVTYRDPIAAARDEVRVLAPQVDAIVALTHLSLGQDADFVAAVPEVDVVLGGHEHENWLAFRGPRMVPIVKADANVRSLAVVSLTFGKPGTKPSVSTRLQVIDDSIVSDPAVAALAQKWTEVGFEAFRRDGFKPEAVVATTTEPLDGRESTVRNRPGRLTDIITAAIAREAGSVDVALFNGGSVRIDDIVPAGPVTVYDIIRVLPFGGKIVKATFDGGLLGRVLETGVNNQGLGGFLHLHGARWQDGWHIGGKVLDPAARYTVALPEFLLTGGEVNMGFLTRANPGVHDVEVLRDVRLAMIDELVAAFPAK